MNFLRAEILIASAGQAVDVTLSRGGANVMLMTDANYEQYSRGFPFEYHGGNVPGVHTLIPVPFPGKWNVVVDMGGAPGTVAASYAVVPMA